MTTHTKEGTMDAKERADRLTSIFRNRSNQHDAIADILDRMDADDAAYRELRDRVAALEADRPNASETTPRLQDAPEPVCADPVQKTTHTPPAPEPVAEGEGLEVVGYAQATPDNPEVSGGRWLSPVATGSYTEALTPLDRATALLAEKGAGIERLKEVNGGLVDDLDTQWQEAQTFRVRLAELEAREVTEEMVERAAKHTSMWASPKAPTWAYRMAGHITAALRSNPEE